MNKCPNCGHVALTPRQQDALSLVRRGMLNKEIANELGLTEGTVKVYLARAFRAIGVRNRVEAAMWVVDREQEEERKRA